MNAPTQDLVPLEAQRREVLERVHPLDPLEVSLLEAHGCVLATDVHAPDDVPAFANSAMDGYAVIADGLDQGAEAVVIGEVAAGTAPDLEIRPGEAVGIMTGAPLPVGADAIVPIEEVEELGDRVILRARPEPGAHIRPAGESVRAGDLLLEAGRVLGAADVGMLATSGHDRVRAYPRPRVTVISTGDELVEPGRPLAPGQIRDSNSYTLTALAREAGAVSNRQMFVRDDAGALADAFEGALVHSDMLVTSGGVSAGRYDLVKRVLADLGDVEFRKVAMKPGMPQAFGFVQGVPCFGLPGNPVSSVVSFEVFVRPAIRRMRGRMDINRRRVTAVLDEPVQSPLGKVEFVRVALRGEADGWHAAPTGGQGSGILRSVVDADGLAEVPADVESLGPGARVTVHSLLERH